MVELFIFGAKKLETIEGDVYLLLDILAEDDGAMFPGIYRKTIFENDWEYTGYLFKLIEKKLDKDFKWKADIGAPQTWIPIASSIETLNMPIYHKAY